MLIGGIDGYPDAVIVAESVVMEPIPGTGQSMLSGVPTLYDRAGGGVLMVLPFDSTTVLDDADGTAIIEDAMRSWVAFRHMESEA